MYAAPSQDGGDTGRLRVDWEKLPARHEGVRQCRPSVQPAYQRAASNRYAH